MLALLVKLHRMTIRKVITWNVTTLLPVNVITLTMSQQILLQLTSLIFKKRGSDGWQFATLDLFVGGALTATFGGYSE